MNQWRFVRTVFGSNKVPAHPTHASPSFTHKVSLASLKKKKIWLLCNIIYPCVRVAGPARVICIDGVLEYHTIYLIYVYKHPLYLREYF